MAFFFCVLQDLNPFTGISSTSFFRMREVLVCMEEAAVPSRFRVPTSGVYAPRIYLAYIVILAHN